MQNLATYWVNGLPQANMTLQDRAIQYGDGFFTTILVMNKQVLNWSSHWQRIQQSSDVLKLPLIKLEQLSAWLEEALHDYFEKSGQQDCVLKIIITRGVGGVGYQMPESIQPNCLFYLKPSPVISEAGQLSPIQPMVMGLSKIQASIGSLSAIKTLNRLENVMARTEMAENGYPEGVMLNANNHVVCATQSNIYLIKGDKILTPKVNCSGVAGTTRSKLSLLLPSCNWSFEEKNLLLSDLEQADELFLSNAVRGIQPVKQFLNTQYSTEQTQAIHQAWSNWQIENAVLVNHLKSIK